MESPRIFSSGSFSLPPSSKLPLLISLQSKAASRFSGDLKGPTPRSGARVGLFLGVCMCVVYTNDTAPGLAETHEGRREGANVHVKDAGF